MGKVLATLVAASAVLAFSGSIFAAQEFPEQEATVTTTVTDPEGKVIQEDTASDTTRGADTSTQYKELQKGAAGEEMKAEEKPAAPAKKNVSKKKSKKAKKQSQKAPAAPVPPTAETK